MVDDPALPAPRIALPESPIRVFGLGIGAIALVPPQPDGWSCLVYARSGALTVRTNDRLALARAASAVWIPRGTAFGIESYDRADLRIAYVARHIERAGPFAPVTASAVLREILERAVVTGYLDPRRARDARMIAVAIDELAALVPAPEALALSRPSHARVRAAVERALRSGDDVPTVTDLAAVAGMTVRTFERHFARETGLTPRAWLRRARLHAASLALGAGASITEAGFAGGYASPSAFIAAYRRDFGTSPGRASRGRCVATA